MNNHQEENFNDRPGLRCRFVRRWEAWRAPSSGHTVLMARHKETCGKCQAFFAEDFAFEERLRRSARVETRAAMAMPDGGFEQRILRAVRESQGAAERESVPNGERRRVVSLSLSLAGAAAGVALALIVAQRSEPEKTTPELVTTEPAGVHDGVALADGAVEAPLRWWRALDARESALELAEKNPLQQEIESISTDARSVLGFLALNFLPTGAASPADVPRKIEAGQG